MTKSLRAVLAITTIISFAMACSQSGAQDAYFSPKVCQDSVLYTVQPIWPRHTKVIAGGCRVSIDFHVNAKGNVSDYSGRAYIEFDDLRELAEIEPLECSSRYIRAAIKSLNKAQFTVSNAGLSCTYIHNFSLTD
jgi:hypothetical protein